MARSQEQKHEEIERGDSGRSESSRSMRDGTATDSYDF